MAALSMVRGLPILHFRIRQLALKLSNLRSKAQALLAPRRPDQRSCHRQSCCSNVDGRVGPGSGRASAPSNCATGRAAINLFAFHTPGYMTAMNFSFSIESKHWLRQAQIATFMRFLPAAFRGTKLARFL